MDFKDFCRIILRFEYNQQENTLTKELSSLLDRYRLPVAEETDRYEPPIQLANAILEECGSEYIFVRTDPKYLWGIESLCKPDILLVHKSAWLLRSVEGPEVPFHPCDIISFHEFKLVQKDLRRYSTLPPTSSIKHTSETSAPKRKASTSANATEGRVRESPRPGSSATDVPRTKGSDIAAERNSETPGEEAEASSAALVEHPLIQCAGYALEMLSQGFRRHVLGFLATDGQIEFLYYNHSVVLRSSPFNFIDDLPQFHQIISLLGRMSFSYYGYYPEVENKERTSTVNTFDNLCLTLMLGDIIHQAHGLIGRGSLVVNVNVKSDNNLPEGWSGRRLLSSRKLEHDILEETKQAIARDPFAWVENHLPKVLRSQVYSAPDDIVPSLTRMFGGGYVDQGLNLLVMERLDCIDTIQDCAELVTAFERIVRCHHWVYEEAQILHRDISVENLMFRRGEDGNIQGVPNDFDLATPVAQLDKGPTSKHRTGPWPYLAIELLRPSTWLQPPRHLYRYDLESFFWVLLTLAIDPKQANLNVILQWSTYDHARLHDRKLTFLLDADIRTTPLHPQYEVFRERLTFLTYLFDDARRARVRSSLDTIDEMVTPETFLKILSP
ncbi:hypothetical protein AB1N83_013192 [Pleurotus pulmonarius]